MIKKMKLTNIITRYSQCICNILKDIVGTIRRLFMFSFKV
jgi:hypothetical protein